MNAECPLHETCGLHISTLLKILLLSLACRRFPLTRRRVQKDQYIRGPQVKLH